MDFLRSLRFVRQLMCVVGVEASVVACRRRSAAGSAPSSAVPAVPAATDGPAVPARATPCGPAVLAAAPASESAAAEESLKGDDSGDDKGQFADEQCLDGQEAHETDTQRNDQEQLRRHGQHNRQDRLQDLLLTTS